MTRLARRRQRLIRLLHRLDHASRERRHVLTLLLLLLLLERGDLAHLGVVRVHCDGVGRAQLFSSEGVEGGEALHSE